MINLWVLIDKTGRILYTSGTKDDVENLKKDTGNNELQVIELKGKLND